MTETTESRDTRLKRLHIRCWRRGTKEMDLLFGRFADGPAGLAALDADELDGFERLMDENDNDLYLWISGAADAPATHAPMVGRVRAFHGIG